MTTLIIPRAMLGALLGALLCNAAQATPVSAHMSLTAHASAGEASVSDPDVDAWSTVPNALNVSSLASVGGNQAGGNGAAVWGAGGNSGTVRFGDYGWSMANANGGNVDLHTGGEDWNYTFVADFDGHFTMNYQVTGFGNTFGLWGWAIDWNGAAGGDSSMLHSDNPTATGSFSDAIIAGHSYTVGLKNNANLAARGPWSAGSMDGLFQFAITPDGQHVPEPGSLALVGLALAGLAATRRRKSSRA